MKLESHLSVRNDKFLKLSWKDSRDVLDVALVPISLSPGDYFTKIKNS